MNYFEKFNAQKEKLDNLMDEHHLLAKFNTTSYPISLYVTQNQAPGAQMALYEQAEDGVSSRDSQLVLTFPVGEIGVRIHGRLIMPDTLLNKIKNCGKKMRDLWQQAEFASRMACLGAVSPEGPEATEDDEEENEGAEE